MRIAMIIEAWEPIWGGGQTHVFELSKKLAENHGCKVDIYTMNLNGTNQNENTLADDKIHILRVGKHRNFFSFSDRIFWIFEVISAIRKAHKQNAYSLIHAHANLPGIPGKILSKLLKIPVVYTLHGSNFLDLNRKNLFYFIEKILSTKIRYTKEISVSKTFLRYKNTNIPIIIPNGVDIEKFSSAVEKFSKERNDDIFKILFVGRLDRVKGIDILLEAIHHAKKELQKSHVIINLVGYGYDEKNLKTLAKNLGIEDITRFTGKLVGDALLKEYATTDLFVLPSRSEGFPLTILEAWSSHLPVIVTGVGENPYIVEEGINGFLVPPEDSSSLANILIRAVRNDKATLEKMGENGYNTVRRYYTWDIIAKSTYEIYSKLI